MATANPGKEDEMAKIEGGIETLEKQLEEAEAKEEQAAKDFEEQCKKEVKEKLSAMGSSFEYNVNNAFVNIEKRFDDHAKSGIRARQTDVLRLNKIVRDVSKGLGTDWKNVFTYMMAGTEKEALEAEIAKIEKQRPVMQSYKAMCVWKDSSEELDIEKLIEALSTWGKTELADHVKAILYSEGDDLMKIGSVPSAKSDASDEKNEGEVNGEVKDKSAGSAKTPFKEALPDRILLQLAKKIGPAWLELATMLGLAESDIEDIKEAEGQTYQGAFKVLWTWRDRTLDEDINQVQVLGEALKACSMSDVAELLNK